MNEMFKNDYIKMGKYRVQPLSCAWWMIRMGQVVGAVALMWVGLVAIACL